MNRDKHLEEKELSLCVFSPNESNAYSETFISAHVNRLPAKVTALYGGYFPKYFDDGRPLQPPLNLPQKLYQKVNKTIFRRSNRTGGFYKKRALRRYLVKNNVDAVLAEYAPTGVAVMEVCREANIPLIVHFHGFDAYNRTTIREFGDRYQELFDSCAAIIAVSRDMETQLLKLGAPSNKLHYNSCGADTSLFQEAYPDQSPPVFLFVGRFVDKKAPHLILLAFKNVLEKCHEAKLMMIGDGYLWEGCKQIARALNIAHAVEFRGPCSHAEVASTMQRARAFVQHSMRTSYGDSEGTPVAVVEAGASGLPVVATRHGGIRDVVIEGVTGYLVDEGDVGAMAERMVRLGKEPALAARMGQAASTRVRQHFSREAGLVNLWKIIESTIVKRRQS